jgi:hypothetical protein
MEQSRYWTDVVWCRYTESEESDCSGWGLSAEDAPLTVRWTACGRYCTVHGVRTSLQVVLQTVGFGVRNVWSPDGPPVSHGSPVRGPAARARYRRRNPRNCPKKQCEPRPS